MKTDRTNEVWREITAGLSTDPRSGLNTGYEVCGRYADLPGMLALTVRHVDGSADKWTYAELDRMAARASRVFAKLGLRRGDRVAALLSRQVETWIVAIAAWRSGLVYVPLYGGFGPDALAYRLEHSHAAVVVVDHKFRENLHGALALVPSDIDVVTVAGQGGRGMVKGDRSFWSEMDRAAADGPEARTTAEDTATILFTSGTTGNPKSCLMPHSAFLSVLPYAKYSMGLSKKSLLFSTADPGWAFGLYTTGAAPMSLGVPRIVYSGDFAVEAWHRVIKEEHVRTLASAPSAFRLLTQAFNKYGVPSSLRHVVGAGEPLNATVAQEWIASGAPPVYDGYGLSEVGMVLADLVVPPTGTAPGSLGNVVPGFDVRLVDQNGAEVPDGNEGRIAIMRPPYQLSNGYENVPEAWQAKWMDDLFITDDLARRDEAGRWHFTGRADDMIVTSGHNVSPVEVEAVIMQQEGVVEVAVVPHQEPGRGTVVRAVIVRSPNSPPPEQLTAILREQVATRIARYAAPRVIDFVDSLPKTEVGKLLRRAVKR